MKHIRRLSLGLALLLILASCGRRQTTTPEASDAQSATAGTVNGTVAEPVTGNAADSAKPETAPVITPAETPTEGTYTPTGETVITLGSTVSISGEGAGADGSRLTITRAGTYLISGTWEGGQLIVDTQDNTKVTLILNGVSISCADGPAVFVKNAPKKVVLYTTEGSVNILSDGTGYVVPDEQQVEGEIYPNACLYACEDLELDGTGELFVTGNADKGINTKDDLTIKGGTLVVTSVGAGIRANDSLTISGGTTTVTAGADGVKTANTETEGKGFISMEDGSLFVTAMGDGLSAATTMTICGGSLVLTTTDTDGEVLKEFEGNSTSASGGGFGGGGFGGGRPGGGMMGESSADKAAISAKGLKAAGTLTISGGKITIVAQDDGVHSDTDVVMAGGSLHIRAADDGIHAEKNLTISGGVTEIAQSYEGLEALKVTVMGGTNRITASDDGANATNGEGGGFGGMGGGGRPGGWGGQGSGSSESTSANTPCLTFSGGYTVFDAGGDGIDSNGNIVITGGSVIVYGPTDSMNGPIDSGDGNYSVTISGGYLLAVGSSGMAETAENAGQAVLAASWRGGGLSAGELIGITDENGTVLAAFKLPKAIQCIVFSCPELTTGKTYAVVVGGTAAGDITDGIVDPASYTGYELAGEIQAR